VERAVILARGGRADFSFVVPRGSPAPIQTPVEIPAGAVHPDRTVRAQQIENIKRALAQTDGKVHGEDGAAALLGIPATTLGSRIRRWGIGAS